MTTKEKTKKIDLQVTDIDVMRVKALAKHFETSVSALIRHLIKKEYNTLVDKVTDTEHKQ